MNEQNLISDERSVASLSAAEAMPVVEASVPASYGARLAWERQNASLGVTDVAARLRLHPNQVRAMEQEDLTRLPALAYVRGFIRSYARVLNVDPAPLLADLNAKLEPARGSVVDGLTADYSAARAAGRERMFPQWGIGFALLVLVALGFVGWQATRQRPATTPAAAAAPAQQLAPPTPTPATDTTAPAAVSDSAAATVAEPVPAPAEVAEPTVKPSSGASGSAPALLLRFTGESWAEVKDRSGKILLSQLGSAGTEHALDGELPLTVVIGDTNFASVEVRGAAFNLRPFTRNNVARFTIK